jgi:putative transposase
MKLHVVYKYPLRISKTGSETLFQWSSACRYLWNRSLRLKKGLYKRYKTNWNYFSGKKEDGTVITGTNRRLTLLRARYEWLRAVPSCCEQEILRDLDKAFSNFFRRVKRGEAPGYPKFKRRSILPRLYFPKQLFKIIDSDDRKYLKLPKMQAIRIQYDREAFESEEDTITSCSVTYDGKYWYLCLLVEKIFQDFVGKNTNPPVGIDVGIAKTITLSNGEVFQIDTEKLSYYEDRKAILQKRLSRKVGSKKGQKKSNRWIKLKKQIDAIDRKLAGIRLNFNHQTSATLTDNFGILAVEKLDIKQMSKSAAGDLENPGENVKVKSHLNRMILRQGWGQFFNLIDYKSVRKNVVVVKVDPSYTTQKCYNCGFVHEKNVKTKQRFKCQRCGYENDADISAAKNILERAPAGLPE